MKISLPLHWKKVSYDSGIWPCVYKGRLARDVILFAVASAMPNTPEPGDGVSALLFRQGLGFREAVRQQNEGNASYHDGLRKMAISVFSGLI